MHPHRKAVDALVKRAEQHPKDDPLRRRVARLMLLLPGCRVEGTLGGLSGRRPLFSLNKPLDGHPDWLDGEGDTLVLSFPNRAPLHVPVFFDPRKALRLARRVMADVAPCMVGLPAASPEQVEWRRSFLRDLEDILEKGGDIDELDKRSRPPGIEGHECWVGVRVAGAIFTALKTSQYMPHGGVKDLLYQASLAWLAGGHSRPYLEAKRNLYSRWLAEILLSE